MTRLLVIWILCMTMRVSADWLLTVPPTDGPAITFFDGTGQPQATGLLTNFTLNWQSDFMAGISRTFSVFCISPDMGTVDVGQPYPGTNRICITAQYSDGATVNYTTSLSVQASSSGRRMARPIWRIRSRHTWRI